MEHEKLNIKEATESRRIAVEKSLRMITVPELKALGTILFPSTDNPWSETFSYVIEDPRSGSIYHATTEDHVEVLYCRDRDIGMWYIPGVGKGPLQTDQLRMIKEIVAARS